MGDRHKQHNPLVGVDPESLKTFIQFLKTNYPEGKSEKEDYRRGKLYHASCHSFGTPKVQRAIIEIFRLENGKIDEHWGVIREVPRYRPIRTACFRLIEPKSSKRVHPILEKGLHTLYDLSTLWNYLRTIHYSRAIPANPLPTG
jgi:predicted SnoaL-like aldol condensation-catalyzing enzyme